jgi:hypothetical protein
VSRVEGCRGRRRGSSSRFAKRDSGKEVKTLIQDSVTNVAEGSKLVDQSGKTLTEIVTAVNKVTDVVAEIATATQEQASGIEQVNEALTSMDEVTRRNAAMVEDGTVAGQSLLEEARNLDEMMAKYKIGGNSPVPQRSSEPRERATGKVAPSSVHRGSTRPGPKRSVTPAPRTSAPQVKPARTGTDGSESEYGGSGEERTRDSRSLRTCKHAKSVRSRLAGAFDISRNLTQALLSYARPERHRTRAARFCYVTR